MKLSTPLNFFLPSLACLALTIPTGAQRPNSQAQKHKMSVITTNATEELQESLIPPLDSAKLRVRSVEEILDTLYAMNIPEIYPRPVNKMAGPWVFFGYRSIPKFSFSVPEPPIAFPDMVVMTNDSIFMTYDTHDMELNELIEIAEDEGEETTYDIDDIIEEVITYTPPKDVDFIGGDPIPVWLKNATRSYRMQENLMYEMMVEQPKNLEYSYWALPVPPKLNPDDVSFVGVMRRFGKADVDTNSAILPEEELDKIHWLHTVGGAIQFSQAYVSKNWYQGGNNHLSLLFNFNWNVNLNQVYHPKLLFQSALSYKLGLNSTPQDQVHKYSISEDLFQYNLNAGWKAFQKWFYSLNMLFKTQIFNNYEQNSTTRKASFLSPGDLNLGLGMAYSHQNKKNTFQFTATISPLSYNLKTCISDKIDHSQFNIHQNRKTRSEIGSNGEFNMNWQICSNINYKSRVFLFTDYDYFLSDWENTFSFTINKFLSTQLYVHLRHDSSIDKDRDWKKLMMREILSFGLSYTWSTK
ncbi:MAG: DUF3078 domain-containing protein [Bacteroides sp.]|nr:DUF3078 domain-containing protein [Bacteroides sp.]